MSTALALREDRARRTAAAGRARQCSPCVEWRGPMSCPSCGHENPAEARFCNACGDAPGGADGHPRASLLHAAPSRREDPRLQERARGRAQAGHRPLRRRRALDGACRARRSRGMASSPRSPLPSPRGRRPPLRGDHQPVHRRRHHGALRRPDRPRGPRRARLRGRPRSGARARGARRGRAARERARVRGANGPQLGRGRRGANRRRPAHGLHRAGPRRRARRPGAAAGATGRRRP